MTWFVCSASRPNSVIAGATLSARVWRAVREHLFARYRPERHYMRGPGPKWREKHGLERRLGRS